MKNNYKIINYFIKQTKEEWLSNIPELIKRLKRDYNFYYSESYVNIHKSINEVISNHPEKKKHKIVLYKTAINIYYLVVYTKYNIKVYYCDEYIDSSWGRQKYFIKKFSLAYQEAINELEYKDYLF